MSQSDQPKRITEFLEDHFDAQLDIEDLRPFTTLDDQSARNLYEHYLSYIETHEDFYLPPRHPRFSRPLAWHETSNAGRLGGNPFITWSEREAVEKQLTPKDALFRSSITNTQIFELRKKNLRDLFLLHHQVIITDQLYMLTEALSHGTRDSYWDAYQAYIEFLAVNRELINQDVLVICSDRATYQMAPVNSEHESYCNEELENYISTSLGSSELPANPFEVVPVLGYTDLLSFYDADGYFDCERDVKIYNHIAECYEFTLRSNVSQIDEELMKAPTRFETEIRLSTEGLTDADIINLRLNDEAFDEWRQKLSQALEAYASDGKASFTGEMLEGLERLANRQASLWDGVPKGFLYGILSGLATSPVTSPWYSVPGGAIAGSMIDFIDRIVKRRLQKNQETAQRALVRHYSAIIKNDE